MKKRLILTLTCLMSVILCSCSASGEEIKLTFSKSECFLLIPKPDRIVRSTGSTRYVYERPFPFENGSISVSRFDTHPASSVGDSGSKDVKLISRGDLDLVSLLWTSRDRLESIRTAYLTDGETKILFSGFMVDAWEGLARNCINLNEK